MGSPLFLTEPLLMIDRGALRPSENIAWKSNWRRDLQPREKSRYSPIPRVCNSPCLYLFERCMLEFPNWSSLYIATDHSRALQFMMLSY